MVESVPYCSGNSALAISSNILHKFFFALVDSHLVGFHAPIYISIPTNYSCWIDSYFLGFIEISILVTPLGTIKILL